MDEMYMHSREQPLTQAITKIVPNAIINPSLSIAPPDWDPLVLNQAKLCYDQNMK